MLLTEQFRNRLQGNMTNEMWAEFWPICQRRGIPIDDQSLDYDSPFIDAKIWFTHGWEDKMTWEDEFLALGEPDIKLACGSVAEFDTGSGCSYRCTECGSIVGSIAMPKACYEMMKVEETKAQMWKILQSNRYGKFGK